ncbi:unnamed protein product [Caenorhabditis auriculariae]|uniref:Uncharacterized protein n=1 Tax=Caenorhabditis auriculariae TaxID=2777116 RepID=A0A8S1HMT4_9PELO|nr:unnamed protein product [Caenorhabditis auriculariae]
MTQTANVEVMRSEPPDAARTSGRFDTDCLPAAAVGVRKHLATGLHFSLRPYFTTRTDLCLRLAPATAVFPPTVAL